MPNVGRVKAAGLTPYQLSSSVIPQAQMHRRETQSPTFNYTFSIEKIKPEQTAQVDQKVPARRTPARWDAWLHRRRSAARREG